MILILGAPLLLMYYAVCGLAVVVAVSAAIVYYGFILLLACVMFACRQSASLYHFARGRTQ